MQDFEIFGSQQRFDLVVSTLQIVYEAWAEINNEDPTRPIQLKMYAMAQACGFEIFFMPGDPPKMEEGYMHGEASFKTIKLWGDPTTINYPFTFFHELAHCLLHFCPLTKGLKLDQASAEKEADIFAAFICRQLWPNQTPHFVQMAQRSFQHGEPTNSFIQSV